MPAKLQQHIKNHTPHEPHRPHKPHRPQKLIDLINLANRSGVLDPSIAAADIMGLTRTIALSDFSVCYISNGVCTFQCHDGGARNVWVRRPDRFVRFARFLMFVMPVKSVISLNFVTTVMLVNVVSFLMCCNRIIIGQ